MTSSEIPDNNHVSRYCKPSSILESGRVSGQAFRLKEDENSLSVNWLEYFDSPDKKYQIDKIREAFINKDFGLRKNGKFAVLNVGKSKDHVLQNSPDQNTLIFKHEPEPNDPSHSGIFGLEFEDSLIPVLLAEKVEGIFPGKI